MEKKTDNDMETGREWVQTCGVQTLSQVQA